MVGPVKKWFPVSLRISGHIYYWNVHIRLVISLLNANFKTSFALQIELWSWKSISWVEVVVGHVKKWFLVSLRISGHIYFWNFHIRLVFSLLNWNFKTIFVLQIEIWSWNSISCVVDAVVNFVWKIFTYRIQNFLFFCGFINRIFYSNTADLVCSNGWTLWLAM